MNVCLLAWASHLWRWVPFALSLCAHILIDLGHGYEVGIHAVPSHVELEYKKEVRIREATRFVVGAVWVCGLRERAEASAQQTRKQGGFREGCWSPASQVLWGNRVPTRVLALSHASTHRFIDSDDNFSTPAIPYTRGALQHREGYSLQPARIGASVSPMV